MKTQFGWYVFKVEKVTKASQQTLDESKDTIKNLLRSQRQQKALDAFVKQFREDYKDETNCADDYRVVECKNAPKDESNTGPASGGNPGGQPSSRLQRQRPLHADRAEQPALVAGADLAAALERLDEITRRLRRECPWDREQDERSIVPHTVEEAYELADAAHSGDDAKLLDELGDVLFQVYFLSLLLEERGQGSLAEVAEHCREKLIRRHPHVFGDREAETAGDVVRNWNQIKRDDERGGEIFGEIPETLPSTLYAKKVLKRAADAGPRADEPRRQAAGRREARRWTPARTPSSPCAGRPTSTDDRWRQSERHREGPRASDPRLARQPDRRGRRAPEVGRRRPRGRALGRLDRRVRGRGAARRRRRAGPARACRRRSRT